MIEPNLNTIMTDILVYTGYDYSELLGESIIVFDFIREDVADEIMNSQINKIISTLKMDKNIVLLISEQARSVLRTKSMANLDNGGGALAIS